MKTTFYLFLFTYFLSSCSQEVSRYSFNAVDSVKIDESKNILTRFPSDLQEINDSVVGMLNAGQNISLYNIYSGKNLVNFSTKEINFDSVMKATFQKKYAGQRKYIYDVSTAGGLSDGNSQVLAFYFSDNKFYIYVNVLVEVKRDTDLNQLKEYAENPELKEALLLAGTADLQIMEYIEFIFVTDNLLHLQNIIPIYERPALQKEGTTAYFQRGFAAEKGSLYVSILKNNLVSGSLQLKLKEGNQPFFLAKLSMENSESVDYKLNSRNLDFNSLSINNYFSSYFVFKADPKGLLFSNGKEICAVENGEKIFEKSSLKENEWISNFYNREKTITVLTYTLDKKTNPTPEDVIYNIDSVSSLHAKVFNKENNLWLTDKTLSAKTNPMFMVTKNKIVYIEKGKENYYFKSIPYNEN